MKKVLTLIAAFAMLTSVSFAQFTRKDVKKANVKFEKIDLQKKANAKAIFMKGAKSAGDTVSTFPWEEGFETTAWNWTFVTANPALDDGFQIINSANYSDYAHTGNAFLLGNYSDDVNTSQWAISPVINIPSTASDFTLSWYVQMTEYDDIETSYEVRLSSTTGDTSAFTTLLLSETDETDDYVLRTVSLASYAGQSIRIAFHNITGMGGDAMFIDDIRIGGPSMPELTISGPINAILNQPATYTAASNVTTLAWYVDGAAQASTTSTMTYTFTTSGTHQVVASATNSVGTVYDTLNVNVIDCGSAISTFPYIENFEAENPCWSFVSADPANDDRTGITSDQAFQGLSSYVLSSYSTASDYNQFLISPELSLPAGNTYMVKFWYKGYNSGDAFRVKVSTTTSDTAAFTTVLGNYPTVQTDWTEVAFSLPAATKYIAINYYGNYAYYLYIDSLTVSEISAPTVSISGPESIGTGNEAVYHANANLADSYAWFIDGIDQNESGDMISTVFTTAGSHTVVVNATNNIGTSSDTMTVNVFDCSNISLPYAPDFSTSLGCWVNQSDSTEGMGWMVSADAFESNPIGQVISMSAQNFLGMFMIDVPVDNWLTSPAITMPATGSYEIAWKVMPFDPDYAGDHYGVYLINGTDKTLLFEETLNSDMDDFAQRVIALPTNINGDFRVAFRHFNSEGGYVIILDDIQIRALTAPAVTISGPTSVMVGNEVTFTAVSTNSDSYAWTVDGNAVSGNGNTISYTFTTVGNHTVSLVATNTVGSTNASLYVTAFVCDAITDFPWTEGFEEMTSVRCWNFITNSTDKGWITYMGQYSQYAHSGNGLLFGSYNDDMDVDQWAISPELQLPSTISDLSLSYFVTLNTYDGIDNTYEVRLSNGGSSTADFNTILFTETNSTTDWELRRVSLADYAGQTVRIAFRNITAAGGDAMFLDDVRIASLSGINNAENLSVNVYPNPAHNSINVEGEGIEGVQIIDINGRIVANATAGNIDISRLANGVYFVRVISAESSYNKKVVKR